MTNIMMAVATNGVGMVVVGLEEVGRDCAPGPSRVPSDGCAVDLRYVLCLLLMAVCWFDVFFVVSGCRESTLA